MRRVPPFWFFALCCFGFAIIMAILVWLGLSFVEVYSEEVRLARKEFNLRVMAGECLVVDSKEQDGVSSTYWACSAGRMRTGWLPNE